MEIPNINLHNFAHYYALIVEFTFAYAGWNTFKKKVNRLSVSKEEEFDKKQIAFEKIQASWIVAKDDDAIMTQILKDKIKIAQDWINTGAFIIDRNNKIYNGKSFQTMFYLVGVIYFTILIISGFEIEGFLRPIYLYVLSVASLCYVYHIGSIFMILKETYGNTRYSNNNKWQDTIFILKLYCVYFIFFFPLLVNLAPYLHLPEFCHSHLHLLNYHIYNKTLIKSLINVLLISLPALPYLIFYYREALYGIRNYKKLNDLLPELDKSIKEIETLISANNSLSVNLKNTHV